MLQEAPILNHYYSLKREEEEAILMAQYMIVRLVLNGNIGADHLKIGIEQIKR